MESEGDRDGDRRAVDDPDREALEPVSDDRQGAPEGETHRDPAPDRHEERRRPGSQKIPRHDGGRLRHHEEFERGPTEELENVQGGRRIGSDPAQDRSEADHRRHARSTAVMTRPRKEEAPEEGTSERHERGLPERETERGDEERPRGEDEESGAQARPQDEQVERPQDAERRRDGFHAPFGRPPQSDHPSPERGRAITR